ncbi:hypothetical protein [Acinetobacter sp. ANC 4640]
MSFLKMKMRGNIDRIKEFDALGQKPEAIVERFKKRGMNISVKTVEVITSGELDELDKHNLPKSEVIDLKNELNQIEDAISI